MLKPHIQKLTELNACESAVRFAATHETAQAGWDACERGDWMLWLLGKQSGEPKSAARKPLVLIACECARLALPHTKDPRVLACIETTEKWARGEATIEDVRTARRAAYAAAEAAIEDVRTVRFAAYAAAEAAVSAAEAAVSAAVSAAEAAVSAAYAAVSAASADARAKTHKQCADIVRKYVPTAPTL
jgi:hypothetical protein